MGIGDRRLGLSNAEEGGTREFKPTGTEFGRGDTFDSGVGPDAFSSGGRGDPSFRGVSSETELSLDMSVDTLTSREKASTAESSSLSVVKSAELMSAASNTKSSPSAGAVDFVGIFDPEVGCICGNRDGRHIRPLLIGAATELVDVTGDCGTGDCGTGGCVTGGCGTG